MNRRTHLLLMELLVMVLVFSLAAAACLGIFVKARLISEETARRDGAVDLARNAAELWKAGRKPETLDAGRYRLEIRDLDCRIPGLDTVRITVYDKETALFSLDAGRQEELP